MLKGAPRAGAHDTDAHGHAPPLTEQSVKLIDFGLSSDRGPGALLSDVVGSLAYCAPEVLNIDVARRLGEPPPPGYDGFAADVWSLGICLFALTVGFFPFEAATARTTDAVGADYRFQRAAIAQAAEPPGSCALIVWESLVFRRSLSRKIGRLGERSLSQEGGDVTSRIVKLASKTFGHTTLITRVLHWPDTPAGTLSIW